MIDKGATVQTTKQLHNTSGVKVPVGTTGQMGYAFTNPNGDQFYYVTYRKQAFIARLAELEVIPNA